MQTTTLTINEAIAFLNQLASRMTSLRQLRSEVSVKTRREFNGEVTTQEPQYDVKKLDAMLVNLENWKWRIEAGIKTANAKTKIDLSVPVEELLKAIE